MLRLVLDTNVWIDWLVFGDPDTASIREAVAEQQAEIAIDAHCEEELVRVLAYPLGRHRLDVAAQTSCLAASRQVTRRFGEACATSPARPAPWRCRDPDDQKFLDLALVADADFLITRDRALLELSGRCAADRSRSTALAITTPKQFACTAQDRRPGMATRK